MTKKPNGFDPTLDPSKKFKYGYGMHPDLVSRPNPKKMAPDDLVDPMRVEDPEVIAIKRELKLDSDRFSE